MAAATGTGGVGFASLCVWAAGSIGAGSNSLAGFCPCGQYTCEATEAQHRNRAAPIAMRYVSPQRPRCGPCPKRPAKGWSGRYVGSSSGAILDAGSP